MRNRRMVLNVQDVSKTYATYKSVGHRAAGWLGASVKPQSEFKAVSGISFEVGGGETVALIGSNGAGKSTLLKMVTGTVRPTSGRISVSGRINALLELGLGFNPEFTGRQNVYSAGGMMGFSTAEIDAMIGDIIDFAEIGEFFEQPLRVYSSGMGARLAFAVATAVKPDLLIVDEVLSVGDSYFQHKSFARIRKFRDEGVAILLVTHGMGDVRTLCDRVILLDKGKVLKDGLPDEVVDYYNAMVAEKENTKLTIEQRRAKDGWLVTKSGTGEAVVASLKLLDEKDGLEVTVANVGQRLVLKLQAAVKADIPRLVLGYMLKDRSGHVVWGTNTWHTKQVIENAKSGEHVEFDLPFTCTLGPGSYALTFSLSSTDTHLQDNFEWSDNAFIFDVVNLDKPMFIGSNWIDATFAPRRGPVA